MGKSTLVNALVPDARAATREISAALDSGRHTTTFSRLYRIDRNSALIDSPGLQVFGLAHLSRQDVETAFPNSARTWATAASATAATTRNQAASCAPQCSKGRWTRAGSPTSTPSPASQSASSWVRAGPFRSPGRPVRSPTIGVSSQNLGQTTHWSNA